jgi:hypothetical protein
MEIKCQIQHIYRANAGHCSISLPIFLYKILSSFYDCPSGSFGPEGRTKKKFKGFVNFKKGAYGIISS